MDNATNVCKDSMCTEGQSCDKGEELLSRLFEQQFSLYFLRVSFLLYLALADCHTAAYLKVIAVSYRIRGMRT